MSSWTLVPLDEEWIEGLFCPVATANARSEISQSAPADRNVGAASPHPDWRVFRCQAANRQRCSESQQFPLPSRLFAEPRDLMRAGYRFGSRDNMAAWRQSPKLRAGRWARSTTTPQWRHRAMLRRRAKFRSAD